MPAEALAADEAADVADGGHVLATPAEIPSFPSSTTLGTEVIEGLMATRYVTVVGILGDPESGKTACLASLYLLISNAMLDGWSFADSRSLMGLEDIARGAREWNEGHPPEQMTLHTEMADDRQPGFLHIRLRRNRDDRLIDLALPDLPGEWTKELIRFSRSDRFEFLKSADVLWVVVDGKQLADREQRQGTITRLGQLAGRLRALVDGSPPRVLLVVTHRDSGEVDATVLARLTSELAKHDVNAEYLQVAPFTDSDAINAGYGLAELVDATTGEVRRPPAFWPMTAPVPRQRSFLSYRRDR